MNYNNGNIGRSNYNFSKPSWGALNSTYDDPKNNKTPEDNVGYSFPVESKLNQSTQGNFSSTSNFGNSANSLSNQQFQPEPSNFNKVDNNFGPYRANKKMNNTRNIRQDQSESGLDDPENNLRSYRANNIQNSREDQYGPGQQNSDNDFGSYRGNNIRNVRQNQSDFDYPDNDYESYRANNIKNTRQDQSGPGFDNPDNFGSNRPNYIKNNRQDQPEFDCDYPDDDLVSNRCNDLDKNVGSYRPSSNNFRQWPNRSGSWIDNNDNNFGSNQSSNNYTRSFNNNFGSYKANQSSNNFNKPGQNSSWYENLAKNFGSYISNTSNIASTPQNRVSSFNNTQSNSRGGSWQSGSFKNVNYGNSNQEKQPSDFKNNKNNAVSNYAPFRKFREHFTKRKNPKQAKDNAPAPTLFMGRDPSYPEELNNLMNPFLCGVCNARLNSIKSANIHYESKAHDKHVSNWLKKNFTEKGLTPPKVPRFVTEEAEGPYHCVLCKLDLTSARHALQHYNGKRHRNAASKVYPPTGIGYYNIDGNWVETGKVMDKKTGKESSYIMVSTSAGDEAIVLYRSPNPPFGQKIIDESGEPPAKKPNLGITAPAAVEDKTKKNVVESSLAIITQNEQNKQNHMQTTTPDSTSDNQNKPFPVAGEESSDSLQTPEDALNTQNCQICGVKTTSYDQMMLHLKGARHTKKLKVLGKPPIFDQIKNKPTTILESLKINDPSDTSMYRTPTGSFYCKTCDSAIPDEDGIKKHIASKAHLAAVKKAAMIAVQA